MRRLGKVLLTRLGKNREVSALAGHFSDSIAQRNYAEFSCQRNLHLRAAEHLKYLFPRTNYFAY